MTGPVIRASLVRLACLAGLACAEPTLRFFSSVEGAHRPGRAVADTVLVLRLGATDSVARDGVDLAIDLLDRARQAQRRNIANRIEQVLAAVPSAHRVRTSKPRRREADLVSRLSAQSLINQVVLLRADYLIVSDVSADTVEVEMEMEHRGDSTATRTDRWLSLVVTGQTAVVDSLEH